MEGVPTQAGEGAAFKAWKARIMDEAEPDELTTAAKGYAKECRQNGTEEKYIKHGQTFFGPGDWWRDYVEAETPVDSLSDIPTEAFKHELEKRRAAEAFQEFADGDRSALSVLRLIQSEMVTPEGKEAMRKKIEDIL